MLECTHTIPDREISPGKINTKVGSNNNGKANIMGKHGLGDINDNGDRLTSLYQEKTLVIGSTIFEHKNIHKPTWTSPDGVTKNQRDHIIINSRWRSSLQDVVAKREADVRSDHSLVMAKIKLRKTKKKRSKGTTNKC